MARQSLRLSRDQMESLAAMREQGLDAHEIASRLGTSPYPVAAHLASLTRQTGPAHRNGPPRRPDPLQPATRDRVIQLLGRGLSSHQVAEQLGISPFQVAGVKAAITKGKTPHR